MATAGWLLVQPASSIAGALIAPRRAEPPDESSPPTVPVSELSETFEGRARERSRRACSQSKRALASAWTVEARARATVWKSAYGLRPVARSTVASFWVLMSARLALRSFTTLVASTEPATAATQSASAPSTMNAPRPPEVSMTEGRCAPGPFCAERSSGVRRLTARMEWGPVQVR